MCLDISKDRRVRITTRDVVVYKRFYGGFNNKLNLTSPFQCSPYRIGETKTVKSFTSYVLRANSIKLVEFTDSIPEGAQTVEKGIHGYKTLRDAERGYVLGSIFRCVIPKGTPYINGEDGEIVSLALTPVKRVF